MRLYLHVFIGFFIFVSLGSVLSCSTLFSSFSSTDKKEKAVLYMQSGMSYFDNGSYPLALSAFLKAEELDSSNPNIHNNLGLTYFMREKYPLAEQHLKRAVTLEPRFSDARNNLARVYIEQEKYAEAEQQLKIVLNDLTYVNSDKAHINMGLIYFNQKKFDQALKSFESSLKASPANCTASNYLGRCYFESAKYEQAAKYLDRAVGACQKVLFDEPHYYSALAYYRLGDKKKSEIRFEEVIKLYPNGRYQDKAKSLLKLIREGT